MSWEVVALLVGMVAAGLGGGAFFAFSNFVMPALATLPASDGASAMQTINRAAPNPTFVLVLLAPMLAGLTVVGAEIGDLGAQQTWLALAGTLLGAVSMVITMTRNVPQNNELESLDAASADGASYWSNYLTSWTRYNTVRGIASIASAAAYATALVGR